MRWPILVAVAIAVAGCTSQPTATSTPTATASPTPTQVPTVAIEESPEAGALRSRAEAFALAHTEARFEDTYAFTLPSFMAECGYFSWLGGLVGEAGVLLAFSGFDDDEPLQWTVRFVEVRGHEGTVVESVSTKTGVGLGIETRSWARVDGEWWVNEPPEEICNL